MQYTHTYLIEIFDKLSDELIQEIRIPEDILETLSEIMKWNSLEKDSFFVVLVALML